MTRFDSSIRPATIDDLPALVGLNAHVHDLHVAAAPDRYRPAEREALQNFLEKQVTNPDGGVILAEVDGVAAGYLTWIVQARPESPLTHGRRLLRVDALAVRADARRHGVGRALMEAAEQLAREHNCPRIDLEVAAFNKGAVAFYEALGYAPVQQRMEKGVPP